MTFLKEFDFFGLPYNFTLFNRPVYKTYLGGVMSVFTLVSFLLCFIYFTTDFYMRQNPRYINQIEYQPSFPFYNTSQEFVFLAMRIEDDNANPIEWKEYLDVEFVYNVLKTDSASPTTDLQDQTKVLERINCNYIDFKKMNIYSTRDYSSFSCVDLRNLSLGGAWQAESIKYLSFKVSVCKNTTTNRCKSLDQIYKFFNNSEPKYLTLYTNSYSLDFSKFHNPLNIDEGLFYFTFSNSIRKYVNFYYKEVNVYEDTGIVSPAITNYSILAVDRVENDNFHFVLTEDSTFIQGSLYLTNKKEIFKIIYLKLQEALANVGGILNFIFIFFGKISGFFNEHERTLNIINELYDFSEFSNPEKLEEIIEKDLKKDIKKDLKKDINKDIKKDVKIETLVNESKLKNSNKKNKENKSFSKGRN